jgi:hypothetical protein
MKKDYTNQTESDKSISLRTRKPFSGTAALQFGLAVIAVLLLFSLAGLFLLSRDDKPPTVPNESATLDVNSSRRATESATYVELQPRDSAVSANQTEGKTSPAEALTKTNPEIQQVLTEQQLIFPADLNQLKNSANKATAEQTDFALIEPVGKFVQTEFPRFRWREFAEAESYTVSLYDTNSNKIAESPPLRETFWQMDKPLTRGKIYLWRVTAMRDGQEIKPLSKAAPEARFKILDAENVSVLTEAKRKYADSPLMIGILYARTGLLEEAEREFQKELNRNPQSTTARKFLEDVRAKLNN